jgi:Uracil DNA glycosylase superfamily
VYQIPLGIEPSFRIGFVIEPCRHDMRLTDNQEIVGPIYYRGRLDGSAKVIIIGQDPAADENVARRIRVGSAGQRTQGFLRKLGLNKSYVMVNTFLYGLKGQMDAEAKTISSSAIIKNWRNQLLDMLKTGQTQAVLAFGAGAHQAVDLWPGAAGLFVAKPLHPSFCDDAGLRADWNTWLPQIRPHVTPDLLRRQRAHWLREGWGAHECISAKRAGRAATEEADVSWPRGSGLRPPIRSSKRGEVSGQRLFRRGTQQPGRKG